MTFSLAVLMRLWCLPLLLRMFVRADRDAQFLNRHCLQPCSWHNDRRIIMDANLAPSARRASRFLSHGLEPHSNGIISASFVSNPP